MGFNPAGLMANYSGPIQVSGIEVVTPEPQTFWYGLADSMFLYLHDYIAGPTSGTVGEPLYEY